MRSSGQGAGGLALFGQVLDQVPRRVVVAAEVSQVLLGFGGLHRGDLSREGAEGPAELDGTPDRVAVPERHLAGNAGRRGNDDAVARDVLDPPARGAEHEDVADARLVDHLLVELADAGRLLGGGEHAVQTPIGDRSARRDGESLRAGTCGQASVDPVPVQTRTELGELVGRVSPGKHVEDRFERAARQVLERCGAADHLLEGVDVPVVHRDHRDDLLREHVERVARVAHRLDPAFAHPLDDERARDEVTAMLREHDPAARRADVVAGAADALQALGDRRRSLDLDHQIHRAHVDAELERARRDDGLEAPGFQVLLDLRALLARDRAVVSAGDGLVVELVDLPAQTLGEAARVREHDRRLVLGDQIGDALLDVRPDAGAFDGGQDVAGLEVVGRAAERGHVLDREPRCGGPSSSPASAEPP